MWVFRGSPVVTPVGGDTDQIEVGKQVKGKLSERVPDIIEIFVCPKDQV